MGFGAVEGDRGSADPGADEAGLAPGRLNRGSNGTKSAFADWGPPPDVFRIVP